MCARKFSKRTSVFKWLVDWLVERLAEWINHTVWRIFSEDFSYPSNFGASAKDSLVKLVKLFSCLAIHCRPAASTKMAGHRRDENADEGAWRYTMKVHVFVWTFLQPHQPDYISVLSVLCTAWNHFSDSSHFFRLKDNAQRRTFASQTRLYSSLLKCSHDLHEFSSVAPSAGSATECGSKRSATWRTLQT